ncbi:MAG: hypothetical protein ACLFM8_06000 [Halobacteriales archaeon]
MDQKTTPVNDGVRCPVSRRAFVRTAALTGAGIASVGTASGESSQRGFPPEGVTEWGDPVNLGNGKLRTFTTVTPSGQPKYHGVHLDRSSLTGLPDGESLEEQGTSSDPGDKYGPDGEAVEIHHAWSLEYFVPFPETDATGFTFLGLSWNPEGHLPEGVYNVPHFDIHFHWLEAKFVDDIPEIHEATYDIPEKFIPEGFQRIPEGGGEYEGKFVAVRDMGEHLADLSAPDNQPGEFENTLIWGAYDPDDDGVGELTFVEPMVTTEYLEGLRGRDKREVAQPEEYARPGAYPRSYSVRDLPQEDAIAITIEDFTTVDG